jgi:hypothetical protein
LLGSFWLVRSGVASVLRVREVADPKCRCAGAGRPRWILETPRSALPDPPQALGQRVIELTYSNTGLEQADLDLMVQIGKLTPETAQGLLGRRVADLRRRLYAQAAIPSETPGAAPPAPLSAPFVSWATGVLLAAELAKASVGLAPVERRVEVDLHGYPADFLHRYPADPSGRCACARKARLRWMDQLYADGHVSDTGGLGNTPESENPPSGPLGPNEQAEQYQAPLRARTPICRCTP